MPCAILIERRLKKLYHIASAMGEKKIIECTNCGYKGKGKKFGSQPNQIILRTIFWLFFLIPGFIYDEIIADRWICPDCKSEVDNN